MKHIDIAAHVTRDAIREGVIKTVKVSINDQLADLLTKSLNGPHHDLITNLLFSEL